VQKKILKNNLIYFFTPTELINSSSEIDRKVRIGGFVKSNSLKKNTVNKKRARMNPAPSIKNLNF